MFEHPHRVMANLGYVQLKANPGVWSLSIRPGRSAEVFEMESVGGQGFASAGIDKTGTTMALTTFEGLTIYPRFRRRTGMEMIDLLDEGQAVAAPKPAGVGLMQRCAALTAPASASDEECAHRLQSFSRAPKAAVAWKPARAEINIFTVASGLLYEVRRRTLADRGGMLRRGTEDGTHHDRLGPSTHAKLLQVLVHPEFPLSIVQGASRPDRLLRSSSYERTGLHASHGGNVWLRIRIHHLQMASLAPNATREAALHLGLQGAFARP